MLFQDAARRQGAPSPGYRATPEFLRRLGVFVVPDFLDEELCANLIREAEFSCWDQARVERKETGDRLDQDIRRTLTTPMATPHVVGIRQRLKDLRPSLAHHFGVHLAGFEEPQLLRYRPGCFFKLHRDSGDTPRQVSISIFLNDQDTESRAGSYAGGSLVFYGLMGGPKAERFGFPVIGQRGLLIAFRSNVLHEVEEITSGERYSVVSWFH